MTRLITLALAWTAVFSSGESLPSAPRPETKVPQVEEIEQFEGARDGSSSGPSDHTTGTCARGSFVGVPGAAMYSRSPLFAGKPVPLVARFASGAERNARNMELTYRLPDGSLQQVPLVSAPELSSPAAGSAGYADDVYYGIRVLKLVNRADQATFARWRFVPQDGTMKRTRQGPVRWDMLVTLGEPSDSEGALPIRWPAAREELHLGTLTIWSTMPQKAVGCPLPGDGIALLRDP